MLRWLLSIALVSSTALAQQDLDPLPTRVATLAQKAQGTVAVACLLPGSKFSCDYNPDAHPPMQSVVKFPLALTVLPPGGLGQARSQPANERFARHGPE